MFSQYAVLVIESVYAGSAFWLADRSQSDCLSQIQFTLLSTSEGECFVFRWFKREDEKFEDRLLTRGLALNIFFPV